MITSRLCHVVTWTYNCCPFQLLPLLGVFTWCDLWDLVKFFNCYFLPPVYKILQITVLRKLYRSHPFDFMFKYWFGIKWSDMVQYVVKLTKPNSLSMPLIRRFLIAVKISAQNSMNGHARILYIYWSAGIYKRQYLFSADRIIASELIC